MLEFGILFSGLSFAAGCAETPWRAPWSGGPPMPAATRTVAAAAFPSGSSRSAGAAGSGESAPAAGCIKIYEVTIAGSHAFKRQFATVTSFAACATGPAFTTLTSWGAVPASAVTVDEAFDCVRPSISCPAWASLTARSAVTTTLAGQRHMQRAAKTLEHVDANLASAHTISSRCGFDTPLRKRADSGVIAEARVQCYENQVIPVGDDSRAVRQTQCSAGDSHGSASSDGAQCERAAIQIGSACAVLREPGDSRW